MKAITYKSNKKIWQVPMLLAALTLFGLLSALLGTGIWYLLSWVAMLIPIIVIIRFWWKSKSAIRK